MSKNDETTPKPSRGSFDFHFQKTPSYKSVHADGFIVSPNAKGMIAITFYSERLAIPRHVQLTFDDDGEANEKVIDGNSGAVRDLEVTAYIDPETAGELRDWLEQAIKALTHQAEK